MVSQDLANLADWVAGFVRHDTPIPVHAAAHLAAALMDLHERATQMELVPFRLHDPEVRLRKRRRTNSDVY